MQQCKECKIYYSDRVELFAGICDHCWSRIEASAPVVVDDYQPSQQSAQTEPIRQPQRGKWSEDRRNER